MTPKAHRPKAHRPKAHRPKAHAEDIPNKLYFPIREVAQLTGVEPYVLRFWEKEFPMLSPTKESSGHRRYRRKDIELIWEIKRLLYEQGFTIPGARNRLQQATAPSSPSSAAGSATHNKPSSPPSPGSVLRSIRRGLNEILTLLDQT